MKAGPELSTAERSQATGIPACHAGGSNPPSGTLHSVGDFESPTHFARHKPWREPPVVGAHGKPVIPNGKVPSRRPHGTFKNCQKLILAKSVRAESFYGSIICNKDTTLDAMIHPWLEALRASSCSSYKESSHRSSSSTQRHSSFPFA